MKASKGVMPFTCETLWHLGPLRPYFLPGQRLISLMSLALSLNLSSLWNLEIGNAHS